MAELADGEEMHPMVVLLSEEAGMDAVQAKRMFRLLFLLSHGYAALLANNEMSCDEETIEADFDLIFGGLILALKGGR